MEKSRVATIFFWLLKFTVFFTFSNDEVTREYNKSLTALDDSLQIMKIIFSECNIFSDNFSR